jgi:hypothetical protein
MNRTRSLVAAISAACISASGANTVSAAPLPDGLSDVLTEPLAERLRTLGLNDDQIAEVTEFLGYDRDKQSEVLEAAGMVDPGGDLSKPGAGDYVLGQYLERQGVDPVGALLLQVSSGRMEPRSGLALLRRLRPEQVPVTDTEIEQQRAAFGEMSEKTAIERARLQRAATLARPYLAKLVPGLAGVWIEDEPSPHLVVSSAGDPRGVEEALGGRSIAGLPATVVTAKQSRTALGDSATRLRGALTVELPGVRATIATDTRRSMVRVIPADAKSADALGDHRMVQAGLKAGTVRVEEPRRTGPAAVHGGHPTEVGGCTWGFTARSGSEGNETMQLTTAAHCVGEGGYGLWIPTALQEEVQYGATDTARHTVDPFFFPHFDNSVERTGLPPLEITSRTGWASTNINDVVCHEGRTTGHSCGWVTGDFVSPWWVPSSGFFIQVEGPFLNQWLGDSGGPWFYGNSAYGIHSGGVEWFGSWEAWGYGIFGSIDFAEEDVHFTVLTK